MNKKNDPIIDPLWKKARMVEKLRNSRFTRDIMKMANLCTAMQHSPEFTRQDWDELRGFAIEMIENPKPKGGIKLYGSTLKLNNIIDAMRADYTFTKHDWIQLRNFALDMVKKTEIK